ncbi:MAG TPA: FG-GAP-like repeat-containing protein [Thermoanaerobaculia bacterium]
MLEVEVRGLIGFLRATHSLARVAGFVLCFVFSLVGAAQAFADTVDFPLFPESEYSKNFLSYSWSSTAPGVPGYTLSVSGGRFDPEYVYANGTKTLVGTRWYNDNQMWPHGSTRDSFELQFGGAWVKDVSFEIVGSTPAAAEVCGYGPVSGCRLVNLDPATLGPTRRLTVSGPTTNVYIRPLYTGAQYSSIIIRGPITFTPAVVNHNPVIFVPGMGASVLSEGSQVVWPAVLVDWQKLSLAPGAAPANIVPTDVIRQLPLVGADVYGKFLNMLHANLFVEYGNHYDPNRLTANCTVQPAGVKPTLFPFPYDWRRSNVDNAKKLAGFVECVSRQNPGKPIDIVAHSMGGLVSTRMLLTEPAAAAKVRQLITMGTPYLGAPKSIGTLYSGLFLGPPMDNLVGADIQRANEFYPASHELLPSRPLFPPVSTAPHGSPFHVDQWVGTDWDLFYDAYTSFLDYDFPRSAPGSVNKRFHDYPGQGSSTVSVPVTSIVGVETYPETVVRARRVEQVIVDRHTGRVTPFWTTLYNYGFGDGTVPTESAARAQAIAPHVRVVTVKETARGNAAHGRLPANPEVQRTIVDLLVNAPSATSLESEPVSNSSGTRSLRTEAETVYPSAFTTVLGVASVWFVNENGTPQQENPYFPPFVRVGDAVWSLMTKPLEGRQFAFAAPATPFTIEVVIGPTDLQPARVVRYKDMLLPAGSKMRFTVYGGANVRPRLEIDDDGDGYVDGTFEPTHDVSGAAAADLTPPRVTVSGSSLVQITATDASGVQEIHYSLDGEVFTPYSGPIAVPAGTTTLFAFAGDVVGNRTGLVRHSLAASAEKETKIAYTGQLNAIAGDQVTLAARLLSAGGVPVPDAQLRFELAGQTLVSTTNPEGQASTTFNAAQAGDLAVTIAFAGASGLKPATQTATIKVAPRPAPVPPVIGWSHPAYFVRENGGTVTLSLTRSGDVSGVSTAGFSTVDQTATGGVHYTAAAAVRTFAAGETTLTVVIDVLSDGPFNGSKRFNVTLAGVSGATMGNSSASVTIADAGVSGSLDGDGRADLVWRNSSTGATWLWLMNGATPTAQAYGPTFVNAAIAAVSDFDGDHHADLLWHDTANSDVFISFMNGTNVVASTVVTKVPASAWEIIGSGDTDGDGLSDILWRNRGTGAVVVWRMNGAAILSTATIATPALTEWAVSALLDANADGKTDLLWRNLRTNESRLWLLDGSVITRSAAIAVPPGDWVAAGAGDFDGNGTGDLLWRNSSTSETVVWLMAGETIRQTSYIASPNPSWSVKSIGDFDGDSKADIVWRNADDGRNVMWLMNGLAIKSATSLPRVIEPQWTMVGPR